MAFEKKTLFIVGAGASYEVGLPIGSELTTIISDSLRRKEAGAFGSVLQDGTLSDAVSILASQYAGSLNQLMAAARAISQAMPQSISIDNFLHTHAHNDAIIMVGKMAIVNAILKAERASKIAVERDTDQIDFRSIEPSWHSTFCKMLLENVQRKDAGGLFDNVSFVTFNYDRCIEHYMVHALKNYLRLAWEEAQNLAKSLTIIHPYGKVGNLPWESKSQASLEFGGLLDPTQFWPFASQIRTFTEREDDDSVLESMHKLILEAERIVFLGFSYGDMNMELLSTRGMGAPKKVIGTAFNVSEPNLRDIKRQVERAFETDNHRVQSVELANLTCMKTLEDYWRAIIR
jgi:hypothetical protein